MQIEGLDRAIWLFSLLFGGLTIYGACVQVRQPLYRKSCSLMIAGGAVLLAAIVVSLRGIVWDWAVALVGCAAICIAAYWNGRICGVVKLKHHLIRFLFCSILVVGFSQS